MLPRAELHEENVMSNEQLNRQRVEAGQIAPIFSVSPWSTLACAFVITPPLRIFAYMSFSLWSCLLECEVNNVYTQQTRHHAHKGGAVENVVTSSRRSEGEIPTHSSAGASSDTTRSDSTQPSSSLCASSSLPAQVCAVYELLWPFSLCLLFFYRLSSPSWSFYFSLRIPCFFLHILYRTRVCMLHSALEFVYYLSHLSLSIIQHLSLYFFYITLELVYISQLSLCIISHLGLYMILHWTLHAFSHLSMYIIAHLSFVPHLPVGLSTSLSGYYVFFYIYYTALELVCCIEHLSLYII